MPINAEELKNLEPKDAVYKKFDGGGLFIEVLPDGNRFWRLRYQLEGNKKITLGKYPRYSLAQARQWRADCQALIKLGISPRALKRSKLIPNDASPEAKELADIFLNKWCPAAAKKISDSEINKAKDIEKVKAAEEVKEVTEVEEIKEVKEIEEVKEVTEAEEIKEVKEIEEVEEVTEIENIEEVDNEDTLEAFAQRLDEEIAELNKPKKDATATKASRKNATINNSGNNQAAPRSSNLLKRLLDYVWKK